MDSFLFLFRILYTEPYCNSTCNIKTELQREIGSGHQHVLLEVNSATMSPDDKRAYRTADKSALAFTMGCVLLHLPSSLDYLQWAGFSIFDLSSACFPSLSSFLSSPRLLNWTCRHLRLLSALQGSRRRGPSHFCLTDFPFHLS